VNWRVLVLWITFAAVAIAVLLIPPIPQSENYHHFVDTRALGGVHNACDVLSNAFFLIVGLLGVCFVLSGPATARSGQRFLDPRERWPYLIFFAVSRSRLSAPLTIICSQTTRASCGTAFR
jgi:hypothetical protein